MVQPLLPFLPLPLPPPPFACSALGSHVPRVTATVASVDAGIVFAARRRAAWPISFDRLARAEVELIADVKNQSHGIS